MVYGENRRRQFPAISGEIVAMARWGGGCAAREGGAGQRSFRAAWGSWKRHLAAGICGSGCGGAFGRRGAAGSSSKGRGCAAVAAGSGRVGGGGALGFEGETPTSRPGQGRHEGRFGFAAYDLFDSPCD